MEQGRDRLVQLAFGSIAVVAGSNAVGIRISNRELDPLWGAGLRFALAAAVMALVMAAMRVAMPTGAALRGALLYGTLNFGAAYGLGYYALVELHAGFGQILLALVPLMALLLAVAIGQERLHAAAIAGSLLALGGVVLMSSVSLDESVGVLSLLAAIASALCIAGAAVLVRGLPPVHPAAMNAVGMGFGALLLILASLLARETIVVPSDGDTYAALAYLVFAGSVVVFLLYLFVLSHWEASRTAYVFVLMPIVTVLVSAWLDDEPIGWGLLFGGALVLAGVYLGALRRSERAAAQERTTSTSPSETD